MRPQWQVQTTDQFAREFKKLDRAVQRRVMAYLEEVEALPDPRQRGKGLTANTQECGGIELVTTASSLRSPTTR